MVAVGEAMVKMDGHKKPGKPPKGNGDDFRSKSHPRVLIHVRRVLNSPGVMLYHSGEAHEGHGKDAGCHKSDRNAAERLWNLVQGNLLTQAGKEDHGESETE